MVCGTADILMKFLSLGWFGLGYDCFCKRLHARKLIGKASPKEATTRGFLALDLFAMLGVEVLVCLIAMALASSQVLTKVTTRVTSFHFDERTISIRPSAIATEDVIPLPSLASNRSMLVRVVVVESLAVNLYREE